MIHYARAITPRRSPCFAKLAALAHRDLERGELRDALRALAKLRFRMPGARFTRCIAPSTLERWVYLYRAGGLVALKPKLRSDRGRGRELTPEQRALLLDIRREHPSASVPLILRTLVLDGRLSKDAVSETTVARLFRDAGLPRGVRPEGHDGLPRQWFHLSRRGVADRLRAVGRHVDPRQALRRTRTRQDGALLADLARGVP